MRTTPCLRSILSAGLVAASAVLAAGDPPSAVPAAPPARPLPDFGLRDPGDRPVRSRDVFAKGRWVLAYLRTASPGSSDVLRAVRKPLAAATTAGGGDAAAASRLALVVGPAPTPSAALASRFPFLARLPHYIDPDLEAWKGLALAGSPVLVGIEDGAIKWRLDGLTPDETTWKKLVGQWAGVSLDAEGSSGKDPGSDAGGSGSGTAPTFRRGDCNSDGSVDISDAIRVLAFLFIGGSEPSCREACDADDSGAVDITDAIALLGHLFLDSGNLKPPSPACGPDPTPDALGCAAASCR